MSDPLKELSEHIEEVCSVNIGRLRAIKKGAVVLANLNDVIKSLTNLKKVIKKSDVFPVTI